MKKVALIGPESTGKTTLCKQLAQHFKTEWVPEYARTYIENLNREYKYHDIENIARMQQLQFYLHERKGGLVFFDTDLIITKIWFSERYNNVPKWLNKALKKQNIQLYLLCKPDLEWEYDTVRENAIEYGSDFKEELNRVMVHGLLHLIGYDDHCDEDVAEMRSKENYYLSLRELL